MARPQTQKGRKASGRKIPNRKKNASRKAAANKKRTAKRSPRRGYAKALGMAPGLSRLVDRSAKLTAAADSLADRVTLTVTPKTLSGESIQHHRGRLHRDNIDRFRPHPDAADGAVQRLERLGFRILRRGRFGITISAPAALVKEALGIDLLVQARPRRSTVRATQNFAFSYLPPDADDLYVAPTESLSLKSTVCDQIDHFVFTPPPTNFATDVSPMPPRPDYFSLDSAAIRRLLAVPDDATGANVKVALVDTGFFKHPYYAANNLDYRPTATPLAPDPTADAVGHGTMIAYNVFAVAPKATVFGFKQTDPPQDALEEAAAAGADVINCSWGWDHEQSFPVLEATIHSIVAEGKILMFASGNGEMCWPGSMRDILSVGGVYVDAQGGLQASNYASGYNSSLYPGRSVPDIAGLCGQRPNGVYIVMPCPPGSQVDERFGGPSQPDQDETGLTDGWLAASGTSSAAAQVAGVAALLVERARTKGITLTTEKVRTILQQTAVAVQQGNSAQGVPAIGHPNIAVGYGLVNAGAALAQV
jgi:hypothetical protein